jgi:hypothetical protein
VLAEEAVRIGHCPEERAEFAKKFLREEAIIALDEATEEVLRKEADRIGEEAEEEAHEEVRDLLFGCTEVALFQFEAFGKPCEE